MRVINPRSSRLPVLLFFFLLLTLALALPASLTGCSSGLTIESEAFPVSGPSASYLGFGYQEALTTPTTEVTDFRFCVSRIHLLGDNGEVAEHEFKPGLIDATSGDAQTWGNLEVPPNFSVRRIQAKVHQDKQLCDVDFSIKFNDATTSQDVELKWRFDPAVNVMEGDVLKLSLRELVADLRAAADSGGIASLKDRVEGIEGTARKD